MFNCVITAQKTLGYIDYTYSHKLDTIKDSKISKNQMRTIFDEQNTYTYDVNRFKSLQRISQEFNKESSSSEYKPSPKVFFVYNYKNKTNESYDKINVWYKTIEEIVINWQLTKEEKTFLTYKCQKAIGSFKGRTYEAWFTSDIPLPIAPWKLKGLPGAVLYAIDKTASVEFTANSVSLNLEENIVQIPKNVENLSVDKYNDIKENHLNDLSLKFTVTKNGEDFKPSGQKRKNPTNPLELTK